jgi:hypothetical protein
MSRTSMVPPVGIPLDRALLCPNDDTVYDANSWKACPTCQNEERVFLSRLFGKSGNERTEGSVTPFARRTSESFPIPIRPTAVSSVAR